MATHPPLPFDAPDGDPEADAAAAAGQSAWNKRRREAKLKRSVSDSGQGAGGGFYTIRFDETHSGSGDNNGSGSTPTSAQNSQGGANGQRNKWWRLLFPACTPLNDKGTSLFLSKVTDTAVMGLVTLATFNATYLLAWGKPGTSCIPELTNTSGPSWQQVFVAILPFIVFPVTLYWSGMGKVAESDKRTLSAVAGACLCEFITAIAFGAWMSYCMVGVPGDYAVYVAICLSLVTCMIWSLTFKYPKCLSRCQGEVDEDERVIGAAATQPSHGADVPESSPGQN